MIACAHGMCMTRTCCLRMGCASMTSFPFILDTSSYSVVGESSMFGHCGWPPTSEFDCVSALVRRVLGSLTPFLPFNLYGSTARHHLAADEVGDDHMSVHGRGRWCLAPSLSLPVLLSCALALSLHIPLSVARLRPEHRQSCTGSVAVNTMLPRRHCLRAQ